MPSKYEDYLEECRQEGGASGLLRALYGTATGSGGMEGGYRKDSLEFLAQFEYILPHDKCPQEFCPIRWRLHNGVQAMMYSLPPKEGYVIKARFQLTWIHGRQGVVRNIDGICTHQQIAERLKATPTTIAKYEQDALRRLRHPLWQHILYPTLEDVEVELAGRTSGAEMYDGWPVSDGFTSIRAKAHDAVQDCP